MPPSVSEIPEDRLLGELSKSGWAWLDLSIVALAGIVSGAMLLEPGSEVIIDGFDIEQTVFGASILPLILPSRTSC